MDYVLTYFEYTLNQLLVITNELRKNVLIYVASQFYLVLIEAFLNIETILVELYCFLQHILIDKLGPERY